MLCSNCKAVIKPVVAVDIDGTIGDYHTHFLTFAEQWLGSERNIWDYHGAENFGDWFCDSYGVDRTTYRNIKLAYRQGGLKRSMPVYLGMPEFVRLLRDWGIEIWLTTTRPYLRLDTVDPDTRFWLAYHKVPYDGLLYDEQKYKRLADIVDRERVIAVVDDLAEMYDAAEKLFGQETPILHTTYWNSAVSRDSSSKAGFLPELIRGRLRVWNNAREELAS
jgi:hypothetical protein